jgi:hypothetical protein
MLFPCSRKPGMQMSELLPDEAISKVLWRKVWEQNPVGRPCTFPASNWTSESRFSETEWRKWRQKRIFSVPQKHCLFLLRTITDPPKFHVMVLAVDIRPHVRCLQSRHKTQHKIGTEKHMLRISWSTARSLVEDWSPTNASFESTDFCEVIIRREPSAAFSDQAGQLKRQVYLNVDKTKPHNSRKSLQRAAERKLKRMPHPPYSSRIARSDFYVFGPMKQRLQTCQGRSFEELQENVHEILSSIGPVELEGNMQSWLECLRSMIALGGEYA